MANTDFKKLNIDQKKLKDYIQEFCEQEFSTYTIRDIKLVSNKSNQHRGEIIGDGKNLIIDFYFNKDGTTTIYPLVGKEAAIQNLLASHILSKIDPKAASPNANYTVSLTKEKADLVIEYLKSLEGVHKTDEVLSPNGNYRLFKFVGQTGDKLVLKHFTNGTFQIQGKPLYLYQEVTCLLAQYLPFEQVVHNQEQAYCINIDSEEMKNEIISLLPQAHTVIDDTLKNILVASLAFKKININLPDYSSYVYPSLRVLEGYIKRLFYNNNYVIKGTFNCFNKDDLTGQYSLKPNIISCSNTTKAIEEAYNHYNRNRHGLAHAGGIPNYHVTIESPDIASKMIKEILGVIERTYAYISR